MSPLKSPLMSPLRSLVLSLWTSPPRALRALRVSALAGLSIPALAACSPDIVPDPSTLPQCAALDSTCGDAHDDDCCASDDIPGGDFNRLNDGAFPARVSPFQLDRYEVTVGRLRAFVLGYDYNQPEPGAGASPSLGAESGWDESWDSELPADADALDASLQCNQIYATWTSSPGPHEAEPVNCVSWYLAFAFCAWDGGRLPTEAEWNYAAAAGNQQRQYPWGNDAPDDTRAVFGCPSNMMKCPIPVVGSKPAGDGLWRQADLSGSMQEWNLDYFGVMPADCDGGCALLADQTKGRVLRGGDFTRPPDSLLTSYRNSSPPEVGQDYIGFRCARDK